VLAGAVALLLFLARSVLPPFIIAGVLAYILSPLVSAIQQRTHLSRVIVAAGLYVVLLGLFGLGVWLLETQLVREVRALSAAGPDLVDAAFVRLLGSETFELLGQQTNAHLVAAWANERLIEIGGRPTDALHVAERTLDTILKTLLTLIALFYLLLDGHRVGPFALRFVPADQRTHVHNIASHVHVVLEQYLRGQLFLILLMSVVTYIVLSVGFHLPYALPIAIATGVLEIIPLFGPLVAGAIASVVAVVSGGLPVMIGVIVAYFVLRQVEDQLVMPFVVGRAVHLHPLVTIFAVLTGSAAAGVLGAVMAVPVTAGLRVVLDYVFVEPKEASTAGDKPTPYTPPSQTPNQ
jgi:predicted PurR-regulated permease PerM